MRRLVFIQWYLCAFFSVENMRNLSVPAVVALVLSYQRHKRLWCGVDNVSKQKLGEMRRRE